MTLTAYAQRRGVSKMAVSKAVAGGRLRASVVRDEKGRPWIVDPDLADREWKRNTDYSEAPTAVLEREAKRSAAGPQVPDEAPPADGDPSSVASSTALERYWKAKHAELKFKEASRELVPAAEVRGKLEGIILTCRTKLLGVPSRARQALPQLGLEEIAALERLVREALEDLVPESVTS